MNSIAQKLNITDKTDWYDITRKSLEKHGGSYLLKKHNGSVIKLLQTVYPEYPSVNVNRSRCFI